MILEIKVGSSLAFSYSSRHTFTCHCFWSFVKSRETNLRQCSTCSHFLLRSHKLHNWSQQCLRAHGLFGDSLCGWVLEFFQHFLWFCWCLVALDICHLQLIVDRPWNVNTIQKPLSGLKNVLKKPHEALQVFVSHIPNFAQNLMQTRVAWICHPLQTEQNTKSKKYSCKISACSQHGVTWQTDEIGLRKCDLGLPCHSLLPRQLQ
jgi:hypothetical protein